MDFYFDIGMAVILRILKERRNVGKYYTALAKLYVHLLRLVESDAAFARTVKLKLEGE